MAEYKKIILQKAKTQHQDMKSDLKQMYALHYPKATQQEIKMYGSMLDNGRTIHGSVDYFEKKIFGRTTNLPLPKRIARIKKKLNLNK